METLANLLNKALENINNLNEELSKLKAFKKDETGLLMDDMEIDN